MFGNFGGLTVNRYHSCQRNYGYYSSHHNFGLHGSNPSHQRLHPNLEHLDWHRNSQRHRRYNSFSHIKNNKNKNNSCCVFI